MYKSRNSKNYRIEIYDEKPSPIQSILSYISYLNAEEYQDLIKFLDCEFVSLPMVAEALYLSYVNNLFIDDSLVLSDHLTKLLKKTNNNIEDIFFEPFNKIIVIRWDIRNGNRFQLY